MCAIGAPISSQQQDARARGLVQNIFDLLGLRGHEPPASRSGESVVEEKALKAFEDFCWRYMTIMLMVRDILYLFPWYRNMKWEFIYGSSICPQKVRMRTFPKSWLEVRGREGNESDIACSHTLQRDVAPERNIHQGQQVCASRAVANPCYSLCVMFTWEYVSPPPQRVILGGSYG